ncbi:serine hydrolase domain-containing protein [Virgisporangium aurantiacum]|nr:serine hydrolase domain-containing protein [Virgisporangium aurantiacum]
MDMTTKRLRALVAPVAVTAAILVAAPGAVSAAPGRVALERRLDDVRTAGAIGALAEVRTERGTWRGTSGVAQVGTTRPVRVDGRFRAGSITKTFLATVVLQLVDEGRLRLDDPVQAWLPGAVPNGDRITVRQLLNHTSGLFDYRLTLTLPPDAGFLAYRWRTWTPDEQVARAVANPPTSTEPGTAFSYTNTGYVLLGQIVEKVTGRSYADEIECRILRPLRLRDTSMPGTSPWIPGPHPHGYIPIEGRGLVDFTTMNPSLFGAGGELISTTRDLNHFYAELLGGRLLPKPLLVEMQTPGIPGGRAYGLGLSWRITQCGVRVYGNDGDALAYETWSFTTEDGRRQATVAITPDHDGDPDDAMDAFLNHVFCG